MKAAACELRQKEDWPLRILSQRLRPTNFLPRTSGSKTHGGCSCFLRVTNAQPLRLRFKRGRVWLKKSGSLERNSVGLESTNSKKSVDLIPKSGNVNVAENPDKQ